MTNKTKAEEKGKYPILTPLWLSVFSDILGFTLLIPLLKALQDEFGASPLEVGLVLSLNAVAGFIFGPIFGRLSDKHGRKPMLLIAQFGTLSAFLMFAFSDSMLMIYISRIVDGCFGGNFPLAKAIIGDVVKPKDRGLQMTNVGVAHNLANIFGPALSGFLYTWTGGIIGPGLLGASLSTFSIILTLIKLEETAPVKTGKTVFGSVAEIAAKTMHDKDSRSIRKNKTALMLLVQWGAHSLSFFIFMSSLTLFAGDVNGLMLDPQEMGFLLMISGFFQLFVRYVVFYPLMKRIGEKRIAKLGLIIFPVAFSLVGFCQEPWHLIIVLLCMSFAASSVRGVLTGFLSRAVDPRDQGTMQGYNTSLDTFAQIVGPLISSSVLMFWPLFTYGFIPGMVAIIPLIIIFVPFEFKFEKMFNGSGTPPARGNETKEDAVPEKH